jgi:hypothetical protein
MKTRDGHEGATSTTSHQSDRSRHGIPDAGRTYHVSRLFLGLILVAVAMDVVIVIVMVVVQSTPKNTNSRM